MSEANQTSHPLSLKGGRGESTPICGNSIADNNLRVAIVGGGPVGMALALALHKQGIAAEIFDARARRAGLVDRRILALSHGSRQTLEWLGVWKSIESTSIKTIHVSQQGRMGRTLIKAEQQGVSALGHVLSLNQLVGALDKAVASADIPYYENSRVDQVIGTGICARFQAGGIQRQAQLVAYAEGVVDERVDIGQCDYQQHAVTSIVSLAKEHQGVAWERFTSDGPIALLPFGQDVAVVLTCPTNEACEIAAWTDEQFLAHLQKRFGSRQTFISAGPRFAFPLGLRYRRQPIAKRQVWLGNAAQTLHPVAGQGFNLALRDVRELARTLATEADCGSSAVLQCYADKRRTDRRATIGFTDTLVRLFSNDNPLLAHARGAGLMTLDLLPSVRDFVARRMMFGARAWP